jgi:FkbM family methyltransferase
MLAETCYSIKTISFIKKLEQVKYIKYKIKKILLQLLIGDRIKLEELLLISHNPDERGKISFSQTGEDMILCSLTKNCKNGFYIDIGAHHPIRYSNTLHLYLKGWRGINIDPIPGIMEEFEKIRKGDKNLEIAVGKEGTSEFYIFEDKAFNTFDYESAQKIQKENISVLKEIVPINKVPLSQILNQNVPKNKKIDILTIDAEGMDMEILETNDWNEYKPEIICLEWCPEDGNGIKSKPDEFLKKHGYSFIAKTEISCFYKRDTI